MKSFHQLISEMSMTKLYNHSHNRSVGMISASRGDLSPHENNRRHRQLEHDLSKTGLHFIHVKGRYIENYGKSNAKPVDEKSFLVVGHHGDDKGQVLGHLKRLGMKYGQDSIFHKPHNSEVGSLHGTNKSGYPGFNREVSVGVWHPNKIAQFSTQRNDQSFTFEK